MTHSYQPPAGDAEPTTVYVIETKSSRHEDYQAQAYHTYATRAEAKTVLARIADRYPFSRIAKRTRP